MTTFALIRIHAVEGDTIEKTGSDYAALAHERDELNGQSCENAVAFEATETGQPVPAFPWWQVISKYEADSLGYAARKA